MLIQGKRPRELHWYHAGPMLFGDWGTSRLYVLGICFFFTRHASIYFMLAMSVLLLGVGWAYQVICRLYPDGGGVYSSARHRHPLLGMIGGLLLCADYVVTAAISALDAFHYVALPSPEMWAVGSIAALGILNYFGPKKSGTGAMVIAILTVMLTLVVAFAAFPSLKSVSVQRPRGDVAHWWAQFTYIILAISGVEAVANMTGIMVEPVDKTARRSILPVMFEIVILNLLLTLAMQAVPEEAFTDPADALAEKNAATTKLREAESSGNTQTIAAAESEHKEKDEAYVAKKYHRDSMMKFLAEYYVGHAFAVVASLVFALLLLSAVNTALTDLVSIQYMMSRDGELPPVFGGLNQWGMPVVPLFVATLVPLVVLLAVPDVGHLADLYAIGVIGAVAVNLGTCSTNFSVEMKRWERGGMMALAALMVAIWFTIAWEKPWAFVFAMTIMAVGLAGRWMAHNRERIREWMLAPVPHPWGLPAPELPSPSGVHRAPTPPPPAPVPVPAYAPMARLMVATRGNPKLLRFALEQAEARQAELLVLFVRHLAVTPMGSAGTPDASQDAEAQALFQEAREAAAALGVPIQLLYAVAGDVAEAILDLAVTNAADVLILGATQRWALWRTMKGDVIQQVAQYLPEKTTLLIHA